MRLIAIAGGWVLVVVLTTFMTWQIVGAADAQVSERPASPLNVAAPVFNPTSTTTMLAPSSTVITPPTVAPSTTEPSASPTTPPPTSSTTLPSTTTTKVESGWNLKATTTSGGTVIFRYRPGEVALQAATPAPGFRTEVEKTGPPEVELEFESSHSKVEIHAKWDNGDIDIEISESEE